MATGKVKWFNNAKGYGFILPEAGGEDLFAHYSSIQMEGYKTLKAGQDVQFELQQGPKGFHAVNICGEPVVAAHADDDMQDTVSERPAEQSDHEVSESTPETSSELAS